MLRTVTKTVNLSTPYIILCISNEIVIPRMPDTENDLVKHIGDDFKHI